MADSKRLLEIAEEIKGYKPQIDAALRNLDTIRTHHHLNYHVKGEISELLETPGEVLAGYLEMIDALSDIASDFAEVQARFESGS